MTMKSFATQTAYVHSHPVKTGVFAILAVLALGAIGAFALGFNTPEKVFAQLAPTPVAPVVVVAPVITPVTPVAPVVPVIPILPPPVPVLPATPVTGVTVTGTSNGGDTTAPTTVDGVTVTGTNVTTVTTDTPVVTEVTVLTGVTVVAPTPVDPATPPPVEIVIPVITQVSLGPPCCTVPVTTPPVVLPPVVLPPVVVPPVVPPPLAPVPQCTLVATPSSIQNGGSSTLSWTTQNATSVSINQGVGTVSGTGTTSVAPTVTTTYTLTATGVGGTVTCPAMVTVTTTPPPPPAPTCTLVANPSTVQLGDASMLSWNTTNATVVSINQGVGTVGVSGTRSVSPLFTTTYTLTATGAGGTVTCASTVTVTLLPPPPPAPTCTLTALPVAVQTGGSSILSWSTQNATSFSINNGVGPVVPVVGGSRAVTPSVTTTYVGTATGPGGTVHCTATVTVTSTPPPPAPVCSLTATPSVIQIGGSSTLVWSTTNATTVTLNGGAVATSGSSVVNPLLTTTYTITATGAGGTVNCPATVTVTVLPPPMPACTLVAMPTAIQSGDSSTLTWTTENATSFSIDNGVNQVTPVAGGSRAVYPTQSTTYTGTAVGAGGTVHCTATVTVTHTTPPPACTLVANPIAVQLGGSSTLTWTTQNATSFSIDQGINTVIPTDGGSRLVTPTQTTTYTGTVTGPGGTRNCSATVTVTTNPPPTPPACTLVANPTAIQTGASSVLTWTTAHATSFSIDQGIGAVTPIAGGTQTVTPASTITYTGTVTGPGGTTTCAATITVSPTPPVAQCVLTANPSSVVKGNSTTLSWSGTNIVSVILDQGIGAKGASGTVEVAPESDTTYTGTFTTTTGQSLSCSATVVVTNTDGVCTSNCGGGGGGHKNPRVVLSSLKTPDDQPLAFVYLSQMPYTGLDLGPIGTAMYWLMLVLWSLAAAYLVFFSALPFAYRKIGAFGGSVKEVLRTEPVKPVHHVAHAAPAPAHAPASHAVQSAHATHAPVQHAPVATPTAAPRLEARDGFRSYATGAALSIDDIVKGLAREAEAHPSASAHTLRADFVEAAHAPTPSYPTQEESYAVETPVAAAVYVAPVQKAPETIATPFNEDVRHFIEALLHGDRETVFGTIRGITRTGGDSEAFLTHAVCALDDAYRSRIDGSVCHPDILAVTADCHPSFLERVVNSLTTAVDGSYSTGITGVKLALTRALAVVNG